MGQMNRKGREKECGSKQFLSSPSAVNCQTEMMRSRFHTIGTSVKHSVCVLGWGRGSLLMGNILSMNQHLPLTLQVDGC